MTKIADTMDLDALHTKGDGAPADFWKALECYLKAVHQSHAHAQVQVRDLFLEGQDVSKDSFVAVGRYLKAAFQGDINAQRKVEAFRLSERQKTGASEMPISSMRKTQHSSKIFVVQPTSDDNEPQVSGEIPPLANEISAFADNPPPTKSAVTQSDIEAQVAFGHKCMLRRDYQAAMECFLKIANQGHTVGLRRVGFLYYAGLGVSQSYSTAMDWNFKAASQGDPLAQCNIGIMYNKGEGVKQDFAQALQWFLKAAKQGYAEAQFNIGVLYESGEGVEQNQPKAMEWYRKAADQRDLGAKERLEELTQQDD